MDECTRTAVDETPPSTRRFLCFFSQTSKAKSTDAYVYVHTGKRHIYIYRYVCVCACVYVYVVIHIYIYTYMWSAPKIYACSLHTISCFFTHTCTLVISTVTTVNIDIIAVILEYIQPSCYASCFDTSINLQPIFGKQK